MLTGSVFGTKINFKDNSFMKWNVDDLPCFVAVADLGGISPAARALNIPKSSISRTLSRLEDGLGLQLFVRGSRALRLTHDGTQFYRHAVLILEQVDAATAELAGLGETPRGLLTVSLPMAFGREIVGPRLSGFQRRYPDIRLDIRIGSGLPDPLREQIDVAVVVGTAPDSDLIQQRLIDAPLVWIADRRTAGSLPETFDPDHIGAFIQAVESRYAEGPLPVADADAVQTQIDLDTTRMMQINDPLIVRDLVIANGGLSFAPLLYCNAALSSGALVRMYPDTRILRESSLSLLYPGHRLLPMKARVFIDFLKDICSRRQGEIPMVVSSS